MRAHWSQMLNNVFWFLWTEKRTLSYVSSSLLAHLIVILPFSKNDFHNPSNIFPFAVSSNHDFWIRISKLSYKSLSFLKLFPLHLLLQFIYFSFKLFDFLKSSSFMWYESIFHIETFYMHKSIKSSDFIIELSWKHIRNLSSMLNLKLPS